MKKTIQFIAILVTTVTLLTVTALSNMDANAKAKTVYEPEPFGPKDEYDRLDGTGRSKAKVDVIEWAGNLEFHIYPKGTVQGLAVKLDKKNKDKPIMIVGYRFRSNAKRQVIRRSILGIPMQDGFKVYKDETADDYDKFMVSNHDLQGVVAFKTDVELIDEFPSGHPQSKFLTKLADQKNAPADEAVMEPVDTNDRIPATKETKAAVRKTTNEDAGAIQFKKY